MSDIDTEIKKLVHDSWDGVEKHTEPLNIQQENELFRERLLKYRKRKTRIDSVVNKIRNFLYWLFI